MPTRPFVLSLLAIALSTAIASAQAGPRLVPVQRFGWSAPDGPGGTSPAQRRLDGGMLADIMDVAEGPDGAVYVLDGGAGKVVVFNPDGTVRHIIGAGEGEGPGEFRRAPSLALSGAGEVFVLDARLARITVFDTAGALRRTFPTGVSNITSIRISGDRLYALRGLILGSSPVVNIYELDGKPLERAFAPLDQDRMYGRTGNGLRMAVLPDGRLLLAHSNPGLWSPLERPDDVHGRALVAENPVRQEGEVWVASAAMHGFGVLADGRRVIVFTQDGPTADPSTGRPVPLNRLALLQPDGTPDAILDLGDAERPLAISRSGRDIYLAVSDPFPQVVRFRLEAIKTPARR